MELPVYKLVINPDDETGVDFVSLVTSPAIERDFVYFNEQKFVEPRAGESEDDFIGRCVPAVMAEGKDQDQALAICYTLLWMKARAKMRHLQSVILIMKGNRLSLMITQRQQVRTLREV